MVVCTVSRIDPLRRVILSLAHQTLDQAEYEIIVVNNGSNEATAKAVEDLARVVPNLRYVNEPTPGLSHARNRGTGAARAPLVAFIDDDAVADSSWLQALLSGFRVAPHAAAVGGRIWVRWPDGRPRWLPAQLEAHFGRLDLGEEVTVIRFPAFPFGSNMLILRRLLLECGGFSENLGRRGRNLMSCEDAELFLRLSRNNATVLYAPGAIVYHDATPERLCRSWILRRSFAQGRSEMAMEGLAEDDIDRRHVWRRTNRALRNALNGTVRLGVRYLLTRQDPASALLAASDIAYHSGYASEGFRVVLSRLGRSIHGPSGRPRQ